MFFGFEGEDIPKLEYKMTYATFVVWSLRTSARLFIIILRLHCAYPKGNSSGRQQTYASGKVISNYSR